MRLVVGVLLILGGVALGLRFLSDVPEGTSGAFLLGYLAIPALIAFADLRLIIKKKST